LFEQVARSAGGEPTGESLHLGDFHYGRGASRTSRRRVEASDRVAGARRQAGDRLDRAAPDIDPDEITDQFQEVGRRRSALCRALSVRRQRILDYFSPYSDMLSTQLLLRNFLQAFLFPHSTQTAAEESAS
jgi:hypothetical protein